MAINKDLTDQIKDFLKDHPEGISITDIVKAIPVNRNTASRYLDTLLVSGQVEMRHFGMAKLYSLTRRLPVSSVLSISSEYVMQIDNSLRVILINTPFLDILELSERDVVGKKIDYTRIPAIFGVDYPRLLRWISEGLSGVQRTGELRLIAKHRNLSCRVTPVVFHEGQKGVSVLFEDITARKLDEERIRESEERYRRLVEISPDAIILHREGKIIYANPAAIRLLGTSHADMILGKNILDFVRPEYLALVRSNIRNDLRGESTPTMVMGMVRVDGTPITVEGRGVRAVIDGEPAVQIAMRDITERKRADEELFKSRQMLQQVLDTIPVRVFWKDTNSVFLGCNTALARDAGYEDPAGLIGKTDYETASVATADAYRSDDQEVIETGMPKLGFEEPQIRPDGSSAWLRTSKVPLRTRDGKVIGVLGTYEDITERKRVEDELRLMKISIDSAYDEVFWMDMKANMLYVNDAVCRTTGYSREELYSMKIFELDPDFDPARWELHVADLRKNKRQLFQTRHRRKDGVILDVDISSVYVIRGEEEYSFCFVRDITERKLVEAALRESEARYRSLAEVSQDIIYVIDREDRVLYINQEAADFLGRPADSVIGKPRSDYFPKDDSKRQHGALRHVFATGQPIRNEAPLTIRGDIRWFDNALVPIHEAGGGVNSVLGVSRDITKRIAAEQELLQNERNNRFIAEHSVDIINRLTPESICTYTSPSMTTLLGYTEQEVLGKSLLALVHPDDVPGIMRENEVRCSSGEETITLTFRIRHKEGHYLWFESTSRIVRDVSGQVKEFISIARDITTRKTGPSAPGES